MNLCSFNEIDVLSRPIPAYPFPQLVDIADRAKKILSKRSNEEIVNASQIISWINDYYFDIEETNSIEIRDGRPSQAHASRENTSDLIALQNCINWFDLNDPLFPNGKDFEFFAVIALWLVDDSLDWLNLKNGGAKYIPIYVPFENTEDLLVDSSHIAVQIRMAGMMGIDAMKAICYAEHLSSSDIVADQRMAKKISLRALNAAHEKNKKFIPLQNLSRELYLEKKWKSPRAASKAIFPKIYEHGKVVGVVLSEDSGEETVYGWLLKFEKELNPPKL